MPEDGRTDSLSLEEIEGDVWGDPPPDATGLVKSIHAWRRVPIDELGPEGLRALLEQNEGTAVLVPLALALLEENPLLESFYYPGDLLAVVMMAPADYWTANPDQRKRIDAAIAAVKARGEEVWSDLVPILQEDIEAFLAKGPA